MAVLIDTDMLVDLERGVASPEVESAIGDEDRAIEITEQIARVHGDVWAQLEARGQRIGAHDLWIAATALAHGMRVATGNADEFRRVPGLRVIASPT